jgi:hypothetical protein
VNYHAHYHRLVERARCRVLFGYREKHHVVPRCLGGGNEPDNIVALTAEEHFVAHQLLVKIHPGDHRLLWAAMYMTGNSKRMSRNNKAYGWLRRKLAATLSARFRGKKMSAEFREMRRAMMLGKSPMQGKEHTEKTKRKMSAASKGREKSDAHCAAMSKAKLGKKRGPHSELHRQRLADSIRRSIPIRDETYKQTAAYRELQSIRSREVWRQRKSLAQLAMLGG